MNKKEKKARAAARNAAKFADREAIRIAEEEKAAKIQAEKDRKAAEAKAHEDYIRPIAEAFFAKYHGQEIDLATKPEVTVDGISYNVHWDTGSVYWNNEFYGGSQKVIVRNQSTGKFESCLPKEFGIISVRSKRLWNTPASDTVTTWANTIEF